MRIRLRGSPSWPGTAPRPDTLKQTDQSQTKITLADGAGHTFKLWMERFVLTDANGQKWNRIVWASRRTLDETGATIAVLSKRYSGSCGREARGGGCPKRCVRRFP